jgi:hypothetical protein
MKQSKIWLLQPSLFVALIWLFVNDPTRLTNLVPSFSTSVINNSSVETTVYTLPTKSSHFYRLGQLSMSLNATDNNAIVFEEYSRIAGTNISSANDIQLYHQAIISSCERQSKLNQVWGFNWFVNIGLLLAIAVFVGTFLPFLKAVAEPLIVLAAEMIYKLKNVLEPLGYVLCLLCIIEGERYVTHIGFYLVYLGCLGFLGMLYYSGIRHSDGEYKTEKFLIFFGFLLAAWAPLAVHYQSQIIGFMTVVALYSILGFGCDYGSLCWAIGFDNANAMHRCVSISMGLIPAFLWASMNNAISPKYLEPFASGMTVYALIAYFIALLIMSHGHYWYRHKNDIHVSSNIVMILSLIACIFVGSVYSIPCIMNTALVFVFLYGTDKISTMSRDTYVNLFIVSVIAIIAFMQLKTHPKFLIDMFDASNIVKK